MAHPNTLVGMATARIAFKEIPDTPRINIDMNSAVKGNDSRFILVLDALASLAISDKSGQVVAMAVQRDNNNLKFRIGENKAVKKGLPEYITKLLTLLQEIATVSPAERPAKELAFIKVTYIYSINKLFKRFTGYEWLERFEGAFAKRTGTNEEKLLGVISSLMTVRKALDGIKPLYDKKAGKPNDWKKLDPTSFLTDKAWADLVFEMAAGVPDVETLLNDRTLCDNWAEGLRAVVSVPSDPPGQQLPVPLFRAIEKLTSHHRHIIHLFSYASSQIGHDDLALSRTVEANPQETGIPDIEFPRIPEVDGVIRPYFPPGINLDHEVDAIKIGVKTSYNLDLIDSGPVSCKAIVHCECSLISKLNLEPAPTGLPINYIGVSKLSCAACYAWIQAFNTTHKVQYQTRGSHGRWHPWWAMPTAPEVQGKDMIDAMNNAVGTAYRKFADAGPNVRTIMLSDSTEAKGRFPGINWSGGELRRRVQLTRRERNARHNITP